MKTPPPFHRTRPSQQRGSALMVVVVVLSILLIYVVANSVVLSNLKAELRAIEKRQETKFQRR